MAEMLALGSLWGCSFLFMRVAAPEFGAVPLITVRVGLAVMFLLPLLCLRGNLLRLWEKRRDIAVLGVVNSAFPFVLFAWATLYLTAGYTAVVNATAPLFSAIIAYLWVKESLRPVALLGLLTGLLGVVVLVWDQLRHRGEFDYSHEMTVLAIAAGLAAALSYGFAANHTRIRLSGVGSLELAAGSQIAALIMLVPLGVALMPAQLPSTAAWWSALALGVPCTGLAYILFFRLLARLGPSKAITVTYLVPLAAMLTGALFLDEAVTLRMLSGCALILLGTALATCVIRVPFRFYGKQGYGKQKIRRKT